MKIKTKTSIKVKTFKFRIDQKLTNFLLNSIWSWSKNRFIQQNVLIILNKIRLKTLLHKILPNNPRRIFISNDFLLLSLVINKSFSFCLIGLVHNGLQTCFAVQLFTTLRFSLIFPPWLRCAPGGRESHKNGGAKID